MAEGPFVRCDVSRLKRALQGKTVWVEFRTNKKKHEEDCFQGIRPHNVETHGKQFRFRLADDKIILVQLLLWGSWRIFTRGREWDKPRGPCSAYCPHGHP